MKIQKKKQTIQPIYYQEEAILPSEAASAPPTTGGADDLSGQGVNRNPRWEQDSWGLLPAPGGMEYVPWQDRKLELFYEAPTSDPQIPSTFSGWEYLDWVQEKIQRYQNQNALPEFSDEVVKTQDMNIPNKWSRDDQKILEW